MAAKKARKKSGDAAVLKAVRVQFVIPADTDQRLGVAAAMRRCTRSAIVAEVLAGYLSRWRLPSEAGGGAADAPALRVAPADSRAG